MEETVISTLLITVKCLSIWTQSKNAWKSRQREVKMSLLQLDLRPKATTVAQEDYYKLHPSPDSF